MQKTHDSSAVRQRGDRIQELAGYLFGLLALCIAGIYGWFALQDDESPEIEVYQLVEPTITDKNVNEAVAKIERENRAFWARMLRDRFGRDVTLQVDWDAFVTHSTEFGWPLYPLNIQQAGIERLLYAVTGLMDNDEEFSTAANESIDSIYITSATDIDAVKLSFHKGRLSYRCYAGDWNGYYSIDEMKQYLDDLIPRKSKIRKMLEIWFEKLFSEDVTKSDTAEKLPLTTLTEEQQREHVETESDAVKEESPPQYGQAVHQEPRYKVEPYDASLRTELESLYNEFIRSVTEKDLESLLNMTEISRTDEETLRKEMESDGLSSFSKWMLTVYPTLEQATFVSLKTVDHDLAGYYMAWVAPYTNDYLNLTLIKFKRSADQWKIVFLLSETASAVVQVHKEEDAMAKVQDVMKTNPLMVLELPKSINISEEMTVEPKLPKKLAILKQDLEAVYHSAYRSLENRDINAFLYTVIVSQEDEEILKRKFKKLSKEILENTPEPSQAIFVKLKTLGTSKAGYYFAAPHPHNPSFNFVYLRPFVHHDGRWKMVFSLDHDLSMNMSIARSDGDLVSRANEVIKQIDLLHLDWVMSSLFDEIIPHEENVSQ